MFVKYETKKTIHLLLFVLRSLGGSADAGHVYTLFYLADLKFLAEQGRLTFGCFYLASLCGPVPYNVMWLLLEMRNNTDDSMAALIKQHIMFEQGVFTALSKYDINYLSEEEVACLFHIIRQYKNIPAEELRTMGKGAAWQKTTDHLLISIIDMSEEAGAGEHVVIAASQKYEGDRMPKF